MAIPKITGAQRDFSAGEVDVALKRADELLAMKAGARQMANLRIQNAKTVTNRPGRSAMFVETGRVEQVLMSPGNAFYLAFGNGYLRVYNTAGTKVFESFLRGDGSSAIPWNSTNWIGVTWAVKNLSIYIAYTAGQPQNIPQVLTWDGVSQTSTWTLATYNEIITVGGQKRTPFYRISPPNITMQPSGVTGAITIVFSAPVLSASLIGTRMSYTGRQLTITGVTNSTTGTATVNEQLFGSETLPFASSPVGIFNIGDVVVGSISGAKGIVCVVNVGNIGVQLIQPGLTFLSTDTVVGPGGGLAMSGGASPGAPGAITVWNDEVINSVRGYPQSVTADQGRLIWTNIPAVPGAIVWSTIGIATDIWVDPAVAVVSTASAIFEIAPGKSQVLYVVAGMESSEFIFCDNAIYFIPITVQNPLVPGSVGFTELAAHGIYPYVQPRRTAQTIVYMKAGGATVGAVQAPGAYNRPFIIDNISDFYSHLFKGRTPVAIAIPSATTQFEETYIYILLSDGSLVVGKYMMKNGLIEAGPDGKISVGWVPWNGVGTIEWASSLDAQVLFCTLYSLPGSAPKSFVEKLDNTQYLDCAVSVNNLPAPLQPSGGLGSLWFVAGGSVTLMDQVTRMMGTYQIDALGNIVPQNNAGENLLSASLIAGQPWTATLEPFVPDAQPGNSVGQRMFKRRVSRMAVYVSQSSGFLMARLFSGPLTQTSPALGTIMNTNRVPAYNQDDDATQPPPLREEADRWRPIGRSYDPRVAVIKDTPGPLIIHEIGIEASI
jgi:hypothetical protein